jgi:flagellar motor switch protein FliN
MSAAIASEGGSPAPAGPLENLPKLSALQVKLGRRLRDATGAGPWREALSWLAPGLGDDLEVGTPEILWRPSGVRRPGAIIHLGWPRLGARLGLGVEVPLAHAVVDSALGYERMPGEERLPISAVEWGVWTYVANQALARLAGESGPLGDWDLSLDRVGPELFDIAGLGTVVTVRWPVRIGKTAGAIRLWLSGTFAARWVASANVPGAPGSPSLSESLPRFGEATSEWSAEAGPLILRRGLSQLRPRAVLPLESIPLGGTAKDPEGPIGLVVRGDGVRWDLPARFVPGSGGGSVSPTDTPRITPTPREALAVSQPSDLQNAPADLPVTLTVELGRISIPLSRLADLKPDDVLELGRHPREPVELTSNGRLVARGELVQIDTEIGVRITTVAL